MMAGSLVFALASARVTSRPCYMARKSYTPLDHMQPQKQDNKLVTHSSIAYYTEIDVNHFIMVYQNTLI